MCGITAIGANKIILNGKSSDSYIRNRVVMLMGDQGGCSGIEITVPSNNHYILTARHCKGISSTDAMTATLENGRTKLVRIVDISKETDLMLLTPADGRSITVAEKVDLYEHVHTLTHGGMQPTYRTDGEMLKPNDLEFPVFEIQSADDLNKCMSVKGQHVSSMMFFQICVSSIRLNMTTAMVIPGSSGGPVLNANGELVGIVSGTTGFFSAIVPLEDIHAFLADK